MLRERLIASVEKLVREADQMVRSAEERRDEARRLLQELKDEGRPANGCTVTPDLRPVSDRYHVAAITSSTIMHLLGDEENRQ